MAARKGHKRSAKTRRLMSLKATGKNNPFYGKKHSSQSKKKISNKTRGKKNPMYGKTHTKQAIEKIRRAALRRWR